MLARAALTTTAITLLAPAAVRAGAVQHPALILPADAAQHKLDVVDIFTTSYDAYRQYAFGHDEVSPISKTAVDSFGGWGATIVDSLSTMYIMGLTDLFNEGVEFASKIDFSQPKVDGPISLFETTIRYVGGLLSAYELSGKQHQALVDRTRELADRLTVAWSRGTVIPFNQIYFNNDTVLDEYTNIAQVGTLSIEWNRLSVHTGNDTYRRLAEDAVRKVISNPAPLPGLPPQVVNATTGEPVRGYLTWGGGSDSHFEYLIKYPRLTNTDDSTFADAWTLAVKSTIDNLLRTSTVGNHLYVADRDSDGRIRHVGSHLECFHAGNWMFGGRLTNNDTLVDLGLQLNDACWNTYAQTATGIGPEQFAWTAADGNFTGADDPPSEADIEFYNQTGFYVTSGYYIQRPEVLESNFYAWRVTGDTKYLDRAAHAVGAFKTYLRQGAGYVGLTDVNNRTADVYDETESFWFAETLKYLFLTFDDPTHIGLDEWVFNTEAHPFMAPSAKDHYGSC